MERKTLEMNAADLARGGEAEEQSERGTEERKKSVSVSSWRIRRARLAPSAARIPISRRRAVPRARRIFSMFMQASSRTKAERMRKRPAMATKELLAYGIGRAFISESTVTVDHLSVAGYWAASRAVMTSTED